MKKSLNEAREFSRRPQYFKTRRIQIPALHTVTEVAHLDQASGELTPFTRKGTLYEAHLKECDIFQVTDNGLTKWSVVTESGSPMTFADKSEAVNYSRDTRESLENLFAANAGSKYFSNES